MARNFISTDSEYLQINAGMGLGSNYEPLTLAAKFRSAAFVSGGLVWVGDKDDTRRFNCLLVGSDGTVRAVTRWPPTEQAVAETVATASTNTWTHGIATFDGTNNRRAYLNAGSEAINTDTRGSMGGDIDRHALGRFADSSPGNYWHGDIAEVGIWNVILSAGERQELASGVSPLRVRRDDLLRYYPVWGVGTGERDMAGSGNLLAEGGTPTQSDHAPVQPPFGFDLGWQDMSAAALARRRMFVVT